jgi:hypothetical protein
MTTTTATTKLNFPALGTIGVDNFVSSGFETNFMFIAQGYGWAGREFAKGRKLTDEELGVVNPDEIITDRVMVTRRVADENGNQVEENTMREIEVPMKQMQDKTTYQAMLQQGMKNKYAYVESRQKLFNDLMIHLNITLQTPVMQHEGYEEAKEDFDVLKLWDIVKECATGKGAHSVYLMIWKFMQLVHKGKTLSDFSEYCKKYNEQAAEIRRQGTAEEILQFFFNAKFIQGLDQLQFTDQIKQVLARPIWPNYIDFQVELRRYVTAMKGFETATKTEAPDLSLNATKMTTRVTCWNCGKLGSHKSTECEKSKHKCTTCGREGHLEEFCKFTKDKVDNPKERNMRSGSSDRTNRKSQSPDKKGIRKSNRLQDRKKKQARERLQARAVDIDEDIDDDEDLNDSIYHSDGYDEDARGDDYDNDTLHSRLISIRTDDGSDALENVMCNEVSAREQDDGENAIFVIDTACVGNAHVCNDIRLVKNQRMEKFTIDAYDGGRRLTDTAGDVEGIGKTVVIPQAPNNLINLLKLCRDIGGRYEGDAHSMTLYDENGKRYLEAKTGEDGFLQCSFKDLKKNESRLLVRRLNVVTPDGERHFTAEERTRAAEVHPLCARLGHPGFKALRRALDNGNYSDCHLTSTDVRNAKALYGKCLGCLEGKINAPKAIASKSEPARLVGEHLFADLLTFKTPAIGGYKGVVFVVDEKSAYVSAIGVKTKKDTTLALQTVVAMFNSFRHTVKRITTDAERVFIASKDDFSRYGIEYTSTPAGLHNRRAERYIQTFKQRRRSVLASMPYVCPDILEMQLTSFVVDTMNATPNFQSGTTTPYELVTGRKPAIPRHAFGQPGVFYSPRADTPGQHGEWGIFLGHIDGRPNNYLAYFPSRTGLYSRRKFEPTSVFPQEWGYTSRVVPNRVKNVLQIPQSPHIQPYGEAPATSSQTNQALQTGQPIPSLPPYVIPADIPPIHTVSSAPTTTPNVPQDSQHQEGAIATEDVLPSRVEPSPNQEGDRVINKEFPTTQEMSNTPNTSEQHPVNRNAVDIPESIHDDKAPLQRPRRSAANQTWKDGPIKARALKASEDRVVVDLLKVYRISLGEAFKDKSKLDMTNKACRDELKSLIETTKAFKPIKFRDIPKQWYKHIINGHMFFKDKYHADGKFERRKARYVINGNEQLVFTIGETHSPTVLPSSLNTVLSIGAHNPETEMDGIDVDTAFLLSIMPNGKIVITRVPKKLVPIIIDMYPWMKKYVADDGHMYFQLTRFVYGLPEASRAFNKTFDNGMKKIGFKPTEADPCVYTKDTPKGKHIICVHVDDIFSLAPNKQERERFKCDLRTLFKIKESSGNSISYLGMTIVRESNGDITVKQQGYIEELAKKFEVKGRVVGTPCDATLTGPDDTSPYQDKGRYVSVIMSLMYLARFTRPDILMATTYLSTKCSKPTEQNYRNALRVLKYVIGTPDIGLRFKAKAPLNLRFYADASHLLHEDGYGHTGITAMLGSCIIMAASVKQKSQARASAGAELIALDDCCTYVVHHRYLCKELGIPMKGPTVIGQDNQSTIIIAYQGGSFKRTKHLVGKFNYVRERLDSGDARLQYVPTADMLADTLTKPVNKQTLQRHMRLLGISK